MRKMTVSFRDLILISVLVTSTGADADPIHDAAMTGDTAQIVRLLQGGANVDAPDPMGTPLQLALFVNQIEAARLLLEHGASPNVTGPTGTPLQAAAQFGSENLVAVLLAHGADPNLADGNGPLAIAAKNGDAGIVGLLLRHGADPTAVADDGMTALHGAAWAGDLEIVQALVEHGADVKALTALGKPPIHFAMERQHKAVAAYLKKRGWAPGPVEPVKQLLASADIVEGKAEGKICAECHPLEQGKNSSGPSLWDVVGRETASIADFSYSAAFSEVQGIWTFDTLNRFLARPLEIVPGTTMQMSGIGEPQRRANLIAYLRTLSDEPMPLP